MAAAFRLLKEGKGDAFVSGGSTGAIVVGANFIIKRLKGVKRAGLATVIPTIKGCYLLMDAGANLDCKPETLLHFGIMGSVYMNKVMGIQNPKVGLVNVGAEDTKGGDLQKEAYALLQKAPINFTGNVEARDIPAGEVDVAVADGFTGNVVLKLTEGLGAMFSKKIKEMFLSGTTGKLAAVLMMNKLKDFKKAMDYTEYGGAPLLGAALPVIKGPRQQQRLRLSERHPPGPGFCRRRGQRGNPGVAAAAGGEGRRKRRIKIRQTPCPALKLDLRATGRSKKFRIDPFLKGSRESKEQSSLAGAHPPYFRSCPQLLYLSAKGAQHSKNNPKTVNLTSSQTSGFSTIWNHLPGG